MGRSSDDKLPSALSRTSHSASISGTRLWKRADSVSRCAAASVIDRLFLLPVCCINISAWTSSGFEISRFSQRNDEWREHQPSLLRQRHSDDCFPRFDLAFSLIKRELVLLRNVLHAVRRLRPSRFRELVVFCWWWWIQRRRRFTSAGISC